MTPAYARLAGTASGAWQPPHNAWLAHWMDTQDFSSLRARHWPWLVAALLVHLAFAVFLLWQPTATAPTVQIMSVSLLPLAPPLPTPPTAAPKAAPAPVAKKSSLPPLPRQSDTALSQTPPPAAPNPGVEAPAAAPASSAPQASSEAPITPAHNAAYLNNPRPAYPAMSRRLGEQGTVVYEVTVLPNGQPSKVEIARSSGYGRLDEAGREVILKYWRFEPARRGNEAITQTVKVPMPFVLEK